MQDITGLHLQLQLRSCVAVEPEEFFNQYLSQDGNFAQHFVETIVLPPANFAMGLTADPINEYSPELLNEGIEYRSSSSFGRSAAEGIFLSRRTRYGS